VIDTQHPQLHNQYRALQKQSGQSGMMQSGMVQSGMMQSGMVQSGMVQSGMVQSGIMPGVLWYVCPVHPRARRLCLLSLKLTSRYRYSNMLIGAKVCVSSTPSAIPKGSLGR